MTKPVNIRKPVTPKPQQVFNAKWWARKDDLTRSLSGFSPDSGQYKHIKAQIEVCNDALVSGKVPEGIEVIPV